ncbi:MAG TPA: prephenate dehydrogenase dimerization domain-containing protein, partial [Anaerolineae bacterium]|nr:prephenate dehydrogenase dimerization domain-containing protein [Anaerolineae bacterium]
VDSLPTLASVALLNTVTSQSSWRELRKLAGDLFDQVSFGASGDPDSLRDSLLANRETVIHWLDNYLLQLQQWRVLLAEGDAAAAEALAQKLDEAIVERRNWLVDYQKGHFDDPELASPNIERPGFMRQLIGFGGGKKQGSGGAEERGERKK